MDKLTTYTVFARIDRKSWEAGFLFPPTKDTVICAAGMEIQAIAESLRGKSACFDPTYHRLEADLRTLEEVCELVRHGGLPEGPGTLNVKLAGVEVGTITVTEGHVYGQA